MQTIRPVISKVDLSCYRFEMVDVITDPVTVIGDQTVPDWNYIYAGSDNADEVAWHTGIADQFKFWRRTGTKKLYPYR